MAAIKMNSRIEEISRKAWQYAELNSADGDGRHGLLYTQKLAELLLQECADVCIETGQRENSPYGSVAWDCADNIKQHFGVK